MRKSTMGIGTLILTKKIVAAYVSTINDIITAGGLTFDDTKNICETLAFLKNNYKGDPLVEGVLKYATSAAGASVDNNEVIEADSELYQTWLAPLQRYFEVTQ